ncbi:unnamed protein product [Cuscuta campestris]|uniref:Annexin n=1 Tax=Cuscuta campestris TaxID=132261 RepID=A0A484LD18_9ASTE|nr:unnamed protein product [Cuscuta campestris]
MFENAWLKDAGCKDVIKSAWESSSSLSLPARLEHCGKELAAWGGDRYHLFASNAEAIAVRDCLVEYERVPGQQGWRLLTQPDALVSRVFKARYFPTTSFLEAKLGGTPSYCWRSILAAQPLIKAGARHRIGNGSDTLVWDSPWLPDSADPQVCSDLTTHWPNFPVSFLINRESGVWNLELLHQIFGQRDIDLILKITPDINRGDRWFWAGQSHRQYTVKDAYRKFMGEAGFVLGFSNWGRLWKISVAMKVKVCLWRALQGLQVVAWTIWALWKTRNTAVWEQRVVMPQAVVRMIHSMVAGWRNRFDATGQEGAVLPLHIRRPGVLQCFVDASLFPRTGRVGFGGILLSPEGQFRAACNGPLCYVQDPLVAEALACREVLLWLRRCGVREVELYSDCLSVVQLLCQEHWFSEEDRARILQVPILPALSDQWYLALDSSGVYTVKSAYRKLTGEAADTSFFNHWSRLWKLNVPPKVKVCFWRALRDILPVACSLESKGIQRLWRVLGVKVVNNQGLCFDSLLHWADFNFGSRVGREMDCVAAGIWALWKAGNMANWESKLPIVGIIEAWTREAVASTPSNCSGSKAPVAEARICGITCSVDAAVFENARRVGVGVILRGEDNSFIGAFNSCINCPLEPRIAETMSIKEALSWIKDHGFSEHNKRRRGDVYEFTHIFLHSLVFVARQNQSAAMSTVTVPACVPPVSEDCEQLRAAFKGWGTNEKLIISILGHRNAAQRNSIRQAYAETYGEDILKELNRELTHDFEKIVVLWTLDPHERDTLLANEATKKWTASNQVLVEIACTRSPNDLIAVRQAYHARFKKSLEEDVAQHTTGDFRKLLVLLVSTYRYGGDEVNMTLAKHEAKLLHEKISDKC